MQLGADNTLVVQMLFNAFKSAATATERIDTMACIAQGNEQTAPRIC